MKSNKLDNIIKSYRENKLAHAFLLESNDVDTCYNDLLELIKVLNCPLEYNKKCKNDCNLCNLIDNNNLPSLITIEAEGNFIKKEQVLNMMERFSSVPVFSKFNIYIVKNCDKFNSSSANTILKFLEEPQDDVLGFFITNNKNNVISTVRSRCQELSVNYDDNISKYDTENVSIIKCYFNEIYKNSNIFLYNKNVFSNTFEDRQSWLNFFTDMFYYLSDLYCDRIQVDLDITLLNLNKDKMALVIDLVKEILKYIRSNGNIELILDKFAIEMRSIYE